MDKYEYFRLCQSYLKIRAKEKDYDKNTIIIYNLNKIRRALLNYIDKHGIFNVSYELDPKTNTLDKIVFKVSIMNDTNKRTVEEAICFHFDKEDNLTLPA